MSLNKVNTMNYKNPNLGFEFKAQLRQYMEENKISHITELIGGVKYHSE